MKNIIMMLALAVGFAAFLSSQASACQFSNCAAGFRYESKSTTETVKVWRGGTVLGWATRLVTQSPPLPRPNTATAKTGFKVGTFFFGTDGWLYVQIDKIKASRRTGPDRAQLLGYDTITGGSVYNTFGNCNTECQYRQISQ